MAKQETEVSLGFKDHWRAPHWGPGEILGENKMSPGLRALGREVAQRTMALEGEDVVAHAARQDHNFFVRQTMATPDFPQVIEEPTSAIEVVASFGGVPAAGVDMVPGHAHPVNRSNGPARTQA